jgi:hypothetical protein
MATSTRLAGHGLFREGKPFRVVRDSSGDWPDTAPGRMGRGRCSCGEVSPWTDSDADRRRWHRRHKDEVRETIRAEQEADRG